MRALSMIAAVLLALMLMCATALSGCKEEEEEIPTIKLESPASSGKGWTYSRTTGVITINSGANVTVTGYTTQNRIVVNGTATVTLSDAGIMNAAASPFELGNSANVTLKLVGSNRLTCTFDDEDATTFFAGLQVEDTASLTIEGPGSLTATGGPGGAGIGGGYMFKGSSMTPSALALSASQSGTITITGGSVTATGGKLGAGIGGGIYGSGGNTTISGGMVNATGGGGGYGGGTVIVGGFGGGGFGTGSDAGSEQAAGASAGEAVRPTPQQAVSAGMTAMGLNISEEDSETLAESIKKLNEAAEQINKMADLSQATAEYIEKMSQATQNLERFSEVTSSLGAFSDTLIHSCKVISGAGADNEGEETTSGYVEKMSALNDNLADLNRFYEAQLTGLRSQMETVHQINAGLNRIRDLYDSSIVDSSAFRNENERMAQLLGQLNLVYSRLLQAMTVNMPAAGYPQPPAGAYTQQAAQPPYQGYAPQGGSYR